MTILSPAVRKVLSNDQDMFFGSSSNTSSTDLPRPLPRINIRKRRHSSATRQDLPCVTSAFLSNLFADAEEASSEESPRAKKACLTKTKSHKSFINLDLNQDGSVSPVTAITSFFHTETRPRNQDSLNTIAPSSDASSAADIFTFPSLPAAVSNTSCSTQSLTSVPMDQQSSIADNSGKESYGWFVETDHNIKYSSAHEDSAYGALSPSPAQDLAFSAHAFPKTSKLDAEVEWAKAADTVDDVLGDFF